MQSNLPGGLNGAILVNKHPGISSFGVLDTLKKILRKQGQEFPKLGHGGTLDPFATGLLIVCVGRGVKLSRYFLGSIKSYDAVLRFGETTIPGDPTDPISARSEILPHSLEQLNGLAKKFSQQEYLQTPPMHSAKKLNGKPLYELARLGIEVERAPKLCRLYYFHFQSFSSPRATFGVRCSSGTYIRTLAQDFARRLDTVGMLDSLHRIASGSFGIQNAISVADLAKASEEKKPWDELSAFVPFDRLLDGFQRTDATSLEAEMLIQGKQQILPTILEKLRPNGNGTENASQHENHAAIYFEDRLLAVAVRENLTWGLERVFPEATA